jgi:hypothetical protein
MVDPVEVTPIMTPEDLWAFTKSLLKADSQVAYEKYVQKK